MYCFMMPAVPFGLAKFLLSLYPTLAVGLLESS